VIHSLRRGITWARTRTWHWQAVTGVSRASTIRGAGGYHSPGYLRWIEGRWNRRRLHAYKLAHRARPVYRTLSSTGGIAHEALWLCIHSGEGAWNANTGNGYYGGLQMTSPWGSGVYYVYRADLLTPYEQMRKAELGYIASGHSITWLEGQWPQTSLPCLMYR
jgi:hypothetical protein